MKKRMIARQLLLCFLTIMISVNAQSAPITFQSGKAQTVLLELYTSEGCSSCPPAEHWLSGLKDSPGLWKEFVPVAFHVDYWDYLGWRDPWSSRSFSDRQRAYAERWRNDNIYTPGFVLNGAEWRDWARGKDALKPSSAIAGVLSIASSDTNHWNVTFATTNTGGTRYEVHAALLASSLHSLVKAGENRGRMLTHDFVALSLVQAPLKRTEATIQGEFNLPLPAKAAGGDLAIAVWVTETGSLEPVQATGGWLVRQSPGR
jgi:hypothetical protein